MVSIIIDLLKNNFKSPKALKEIDDFLERKLQLNE